MTTAEKIGRVCEVLKQRGEAGSPYQVARLLGVSPSTVLRWAGGGVEPRRRQAEALDLLYRTVVRAEQDNQDAKRILGSLLAATGAGLLGLGLGGVLIAAGLGWILGDQPEKEEGE